MKKTIKGTRYPKDVIHWWLKEHKLNQAWLARMMKRPEKTLSEIMSMKTAVTAQTALELEGITGIKSDFILKLQNNLDLDKQKYPNTFNHIKELEGKHYDK